MQGKKIACGDSWRRHVSAMAAGNPAPASETPKRGGTLTYMIPAEAPPSLDGHRESTYATVHTVAPFYSVLMRVDPSNPSDTTHFVCDLCLEVPTPTDGGKTYTFKIRTGVKFQDGTPLTAADARGQAGTRSSLFRERRAQRARELVLDGG